MATTFPATNIIPKEIQREAATLRDNYEKIMKHEGKFVLIKGDSIVSYSETYSAAVNEGYKRFRLENFLVRQVRATENVVRAMRCGVIKQDGKLRLTRAKVR